MDAVFDYLGSMEIPPLTTLLGYGVTGFVAIFTFYAYFVFTRWEKDFSGKRLRRTADNCPSNKQPPAVAR